MNLEKEKNECFAPFNETGEYGFWDKDQQTALLAEFDPETNILTVNEGEDSGDSHGEGVASVMAVTKLQADLMELPPVAKLLTTI